MNTDRGYRCDRGVPGAQNDQPSLFLDRAK